MGWGRLGEFAFLSNLVELAFLVMVSFFGSFGQAGIWGFLFSSTFVFFRRSKAGTL